MQYRGYLFSNLYSKNKGEFVCINKDQEFYGTRGGSSDNAGMLYQVETQCGSLPCPPFTEDREVVCTVCVADDIAERCPYYRYGSFCLWECPKNMYTDESQNCHRCHDQCVEGCYGPGNQECVGKCKAFTYRAANWTNGRYSCVETCPSNTYPSDDRECVLDTGWLMYAVELLQGDSSDLCDRISHVWKTRTE